MFQETFSNMECVQCITKYILGLFWDILTIHNTTINLFLSVPNETQNWGKFVSPE